MEVIIPEFLDDLPKPRLVVEQKDRYLAIAAHATSVFFPVIGPLVTLILGRKSLYGRFHAWRALIGDLKLIVCTVLITIISVGHSIYMAIQNFQSGIGTGSVWQLILNMLIKGVIIWLILGAFELVNTVSSIMEALQVARKDHWPIKSGTDRFCAKQSRLGNSLTLPPRNN